MLNSGWISTPGKSSSNKVYPSPKSNYSFFVEEVYNAPTFAFPNHILNLTLSHFAVHTGLKNRGTCVVRRPGLLQNSLIQAVLVT